MWKHILCANFVKFGGPEVCEIARGSPDRKTKQNFGTLSCSRFCADRAQNLSGTAPDNILEVPQISSKPFTSGGVIARCVNVVEMRHKVFLILHENQGYDKWRTSEASAEGCKMAMWCTMWQKCW